ncbi:cis-Golgi t-SNARE syntaxin [Thoreauomyces humboldtii]|nr:cis-Golgi t-SNARE syntaxin [Thoreauomyces humboldtii]
MTVKDRTVEFQAAVESILSRSGPGSVLPAERHGLLSPNGGNHAPQTKSEFARLSAGIGREINTTVSKLQKLARLAKRKTLFDDRPVEINELIYIIKQDIAKINQQILQLSAWMRKHGTGTAGGNAPARGSGGPQVDPATNKQVREHSTNVITSLQSKLATTSNEFKNILEIRTENMKEQKSRRDQYSSFSGGPAPSSTGPGAGGIMGGGGGGGPGAGDSPLYNPQGRSSTPNGQLPPGDGQVVIDFGGVGGQQQQQQQQLVPTSQAINMEIIESRSQAIESIESTIAELGQIYQNFASMVASQREMVQRIDENVLDIEMNVEGAHSQLLKYYQNISSNRWLMIKVFAVLIVFFMMFVLMT